MVSIIARGTCIPLQSTSVSPAQCCCNFFSRSSYFRMESSTNVRKYTVGVIVGYLLGEMLGFEVGDLLGFTVGGLVGFGVVVVVDLLGFMLGFEVVDLLGFPVGGLVGFGVVVVVFRGAPRLIVCSVWAYDIANSKVASSNFIVNYNLSSL